MEDTNIMGRVVVDCGALDMGLGLFCGFGFSWASHPKYPKYTNTTYTVGC